jgi:hypothetical protein
MSSNQLDDSALTQHGTFILCSQLDNQTRHKWGRHGALAANESKCQAAPATRLALIHVIMKSQSVSLPLFALKGQLEVPYVNTIVSWIHHGCVVLELYVGATGKDVPE